MDLNSKLTRFQHNKIYTYIGEVLVSVNPYKNLDIYSMQHMAQYRGREMFEGKDTCVLISGESGSGKTEASKFIMKYIAANTTQVHRDYIDRVKNVLIQSNSILETFGNAKTNRNGNSSRFGKYMDIHFDYKGDPVGGHISNYLLEKSRVLLSTNNATTKKFGLSSSAVYQILGNERATAQDSKLFSQTNSAFSALGFTDSVVNDIWSIVAGVILLGELTFTESQDGQLIIGGPVKQCTSALGVTEQALRSSMAGRVLSAGGDLVNKEHSLMDANYTRLALAKAAYDRLFTWIVQQISDKQLLEAMDRRLNGHKHYTSRQLAPTDKKLKHGVDFRITHYAGDVTYAITGFMDKNKDSLWQDLKRLLHSSQNESLADMWPEGGTHIQKRPPSAATLFRNSMAALVTGLQSKEPFYVRCVKPNPYQAPTNWDDQLYTWPNFRGNSDKDAVMVLLRDLHVTDVQFGHTKLFIRSAKTLHGLEAARAELIPSIVILLQKLWRGTLARMRYKKMKAAYTIYNAWKRYRLRCYIAALQQELQRNRNVIRTWPGAPRRVPAALLQAAYRRWRAYLVLKPVPRDHWPQLKMKICAASALRGRRAHWGQNRHTLFPTTISVSFVYTATYQSQLSSLQRSQQVGRAMFSCRVHKFNRYNKLAERCLLITDSHIFKLDANTFKPLKKPTAITEVGAIRIMSTDVQLVVISIPSAKNDLVVGLVAPTVNQTGAPGDLVGELLGVMANRYNMLTGQELVVEVESGATTRCTLGGKTRALQLPGPPAQAQAAQPTQPFTHAHNVITYHPASARA
ncbi:hypothetical protein HF086_013522 [Spodoptera exigua]|uniref:Myosin-IA n=1 Tax=Spodoptera exigua TaxID=7107 RepID=A0A922M6S6_SPOEX|nr:hypothetical protein HF086_013522 [Spodoptera exigua]